jgi:hypothetical protein
MAADANMNRIKQRLEIIEDLSAAELARLIGISPSTMSAAFRGITRDSDMVRKHPLEILSDAILSALVLYPLLGCSMMDAFWYNFFAATGEYFYHANVKTPRWLRFLIQTPELHSIHHEYDVHKYNFSDIPLWDRLFGTYKDATDFSQRCGFPKGAEEKLGAMLVFKDVYREESG